MILINIILVNTLNELGHFNIALNTLKELRKSFKNE